MSALGDTSGSEKLTGPLRLWACCKQVKKGSPITSVIASEKLETKLEIIMKIEVNQLRGLTLEDGSEGSIFGDSSDKGDTVTVIFGVL